MNHIWTNFYTVELIWITSASVKDDVEKFSIDQTPHPINVVAFIC